MSKLVKIAIGVAAAAAAVLPATPAVADDNPCKGQAPGPHCRPPCTFTPVVEPGDPVNGHGPYVYIREGGC